MAATYGWSARRVEHKLTDELLVLYLDEAQDRLGNLAQARFDSMVEAVRAGSIFSRDVGDRQHSRWARDRARRGSRKPGLTGAALEAAVMGIARLFPDNVMRGTV